MATLLVLKNSVQEDKRPNSAALGKGEISVNHHASGPFLSVVDTAGKVQQIAGVRIDPSAPSGPVRGTQWLNTNDQSLYFHDGSSWIKVAGSASGGGGGGSVTLIGGDGIEATESGGVWTLDWDYDNTRGLNIDAGQAYVRLKPGGGLKFDNGEIKIDKSGSAGVDLSYKADGDNAGTIENTDGTDATIPVATNSVAGLFTGAEKQKLASALQPGDDISGLNNDAGYVKSSDIIGTDLSNTPSANVVVVESSTGTNTTIGAATSSTAGVMTAADKASLDGDFVKLSGGPDAQVITGNGGLKTNGLEVDGNAVFKEAGFGPRAEYPDFPDRPFGRFVEINRDSAPGIRIDPKAADTSVGNIGRMIQITGSCTEEYKDKTTSNQIIGIDSSFGLSTANDDDDPINWAKKGFIQLRAACTASMGTGGEEGYRPKEYAAINTFRSAKLNFKAFDKAPAISSGLKLNQDEVDWSEITYDADGDPTDPADNTTKITLPRCWSIYSSGLAPSYHESSFYFNTEVRDPGKDNLESGIVISGKNASYMSNDNSVPLTLHRGRAGIILSFRNSSAHNADSSAPAGAEIGTVQINESRIQITGLAGGPLIADSGADPRLVRSTAAIDDATAIVKQLQPAVINDSYHGFTAAALADLVPAAVSGKAGATEDIGTIFDADGSVYATDELEPTPEQLQYSVISPDAEDDDDTAPMVVRQRTWKKTQTRDVYQGVDQTKLIPLLTKALQEALERIEVLEAAAGVSSAGALTAPDTERKRARNADGTYKANDPSTPENEAWES